MPGNQWKPGLPRACHQWLGDVAANLRKASVWQPMLKNVLSTTIVIIIAVIPAVVKVYGTSTFLGAMTSIFGQPGQRFAKSKPSSENNYHTGAFALLILVVTV